MNTLEGCAVIQDGRIVHCNEVLALIIGGTTADALAMSPGKAAELVHPGDRDLLVREAREVAAGSRLSLHRTVRVVRASLEVRWVEIQVARVLLDGRPALHAACLDVTDHRDGEEALRASEERFRALIDSAPLAVAVSRRGTGIYGNRVFRALVGLPDGVEIQGSTFSEYVTPALRDGMVGWAPPRAGGAPSGVEVETTGRRADGSTFPCRVAVADIILPDGPAVVAFIVDLTTEKDAEKKLTDSQAKLRNLATHLLYAREQERKQVARVVHDELGQDLTALKMAVQWLSRRLGGRPGAVQEKLREVVDLADRTIGTVQRLSSELRPGVLDELGLAAAIEWLGADFSRRYQVPCSVSVTVAEHRIGGNAAVMLYRIVQETLTNIARHAKAGAAAVDIGEIGGALRLQVRDDGVGITDAQVASHTSIGLIGIRERVEALGGGLSVTGAPGAGTTVLALIPLPPTGGLA